MTVGITDLPPEGMQLPGVALAGDPERGTKTTEGISLLFTTSGVTVQGPQPQIERLLVWSALDSATCREKIQLPDGRQSAILELTSGGQSIRFLLPSDTVSPGQAAYLDQALPTWLVHYKGAPAPGASGGENAPAPEPEVGVTLPAPGPSTSEAADPTDAPRQSPAPAYATAAAAAGSVIGAPGPPAGGPAAPFGPDGGDATNGAATDPLPTMQAPPAQAPPSPPAPGAPFMPTPPPPPAPAAPAAVGPVPPVGPAGATPAPSGATANGWDDPPLGTASPDVTPPKAKKPRFALTRKQLRAAEAAAAGGVIAGTARTVDTGPIAPGTPVGSASSAPPPPSDAAVDGAPKAKKPKFALTRKQLRAAEAASSATDPPPAAAPVDPVPLAVQPPPPFADREAAIPTPPTQTRAPSDGMPPPGRPDGSSTSHAGVVLADTGAKPNRRSLVLLVALLVLVAAVGAGYLISKRSSSTTSTAPPAPSPGVAETALAASINLRLGDLPTSWSVAPPAQAVVRPPVVATGAGAAAANTMASCLNTSAPVIAGLFGSGPLPGQSAMMQSSTFQSATGGAFEMSSRTTTMTSPGQVQALNGIFTGPNFDSCFQQFRTAMARISVPGATVDVQPVTLTAPTGVQAYGVVSTYTLPGTGTEVVGDAYLLGGRAVTVVQPSTNGPAIPSDVFAPAFNAVAGRLAAAISK